MPYSIEYFHPKVLAEIEAWPADILADYARIAELQTLQDIRACEARIERMNAR